MRGIRAVVAGLLFGLAACAQLSRPESAPVPPPKPAPKPAAPDGSAVAPFNPEVLIGTDEVGVRSRLGPPTRTREQPPSTVWVYGDYACRLDVFFFLDMNSDRMRVLSYELRVLDDTAAARAACLERLGQHGAV